MSPVKTATSRATHYRTISSIRRKNAIMFKRAKAIRNMFERQRGKPAPEPSPAVPISAKATVTTDDSLAVIFTMMIKHGLSKSCIPDLLDIIKLVRAPDDEDKTSNDSLGSSYKLFKELSKRRKEHLSEEDVFWHHYCENCERKFENEERFCKFCSHPRYDAAGKPLRAFMEMNPVTQLQDMFRGREILLFV